MLGQPEKSIGRVERESSNSPIVTATLTCNKKRLAAILQDPEGQVR